MLYGILLLPSVQTAVVNYITDEISDDLGTKISIQRVHLRPFKTLVLNDIVVFDQQKDTLLAIEQVSANIDSVFFKKKQLNLSRLQLHQPVINLVKADSVYNYQFLVDALKGEVPNKETKGWAVSLQHLIVEQAFLGYDQGDSTSFFSASSLDVNISNIRKDSLWHLNLESLRFDNSKGIKLSGAKGRLSIGEKGLILSKGTLQTKHSFLQVDSLNINLDPEKKGLDKIGYFYFDLQKSDIGRHDLQMISSVKRATDIIISGQVYGTVDNIKGRQVTLSFGPHSQLQSSFDINGLPNLDETFVYFNVAQLKTTPEDLKQLLAHISGQALHLPNAIQNLEQIRYKGNFTGFITDLVAYGEFSTALGKISTDIGLKLDASNHLIFSGNLSTNQFDIGKLANAEKYLGRVSMSVAINGKRQSASNYSAYLNGMVDTLSVNNYKYTNIKLNGLFANDKFDGDFLIDDPNGQVGFNGMIDLAGDIPNYSFKASLTELRLDRLNLSNKYTNSLLTGDLETDISGKDLNDIVGYLHLRNLDFTSDEHSVEVDSLLLISVREGERKRIVLQSDIAEGDLVGNYNFTHIGNLLKQHLLRYLPSLNSVIGLKDVDDQENDFSFSCSLKKVSDVVKLLIPGMDVSDNGLILGQFNSDTGKMDVEIEMQYFNYKNIEANQPEVHVSTGNGNKLSVVTRLKNLDFNKFLSFQNLSFHHSVHQDTIAFNVFWNNWDEFTNSGSIITSTSLKVRDKGIYTTTELMPSYVMVKDSLWEFQPTTIHYHPDGFSLRNFRVHHGRQEIGINGFVHRFIEDGLKVHFQNISLSDAIGYQDLNQVDISGFLNGTLDVQKLYQSPVISGDLSIDDFIFNKDKLGDFSIEADYEPSKEQINIQTSVINGDHTPLSGGGIINLANRQINLQYDIDKLEIGFINLYLSKVMQNLSGTASGQLAVVGSLTRPELVGKIKVNKAFFDIGLLQTTYSMTDSVLFHPNQMEFKNIKITDRNGKVGTFNGTIDHSGFRDMNYNLRLITNNMLVLDTKYTDNPLYYGEVYADGNLSVTGTTKDLFIDIAGQTKENSEFFIPLTDDESAEESNFIRFVDHTSASNSTLIKSEETNDDYEIDLTGMTVNMDLDITPDARCQVIFDSKVGDILRGVGNGNLQIKMDKEGGINFFGDYNFEDGDYMFTLQNVLNKKFVINPGSSINWNGDPYDADIDLNASYKLKTSLIDLIGDYSEEAQKDYGRRIPVHCDLLLTDRLTKPNVKFDIKTPSTQDNNQNIIDSYINTEEETNRQVLSLLVLNKFYSQENQSDNSQAGRSAGNNAALVTTTEMLSNQLSHWLSQISRDVDIGVSYRPAGELTNDEVEVALSTQMFNNRVLVNGNVGYGKDQTRPSNLIGDFDVEVKLNTKGNIRAKAYTHTNNDLIYSTNTSPTTQGVGVSFNEEFDSLEELMHKYWMKISGKKNEKPNKTDNKE
ncbi:translocation/assembly module TamB domain-containing protein [Carboxylicivirga sp. M1479]|uniref:translocation/assembly module TamB domain-containing protein n=1 Tax=Carboxylicivirga sp. M1479 TaxID=2594476 RepID=UPI0011775925|nr:translocation/assembly module TamB domain-containing protein [Carboxylicivirga sp. M1479]TRX63003.1 translocation/assembly module TamB [Carboxylicivirga sp. M1479]